MASAMGSLFSVGSNSRLFKGKEKIAASCSLVSPAVRGKEGASFSAFRGKEGSLFSVFGGQERAAAYVKKSLTINASKKIAIISSPSGIGDELSKELRHSSAVSTLNHYDLGSVNYFDACMDGNSSKGLKGKLTGMDIVVIVVDGWPRVLTYEENAFKAQARLIRGCVEAVADHCPDACVVISHHLLNSVVPFAAQVLKRRQVYDRRKLIGLLTPQTEFAKIKAAYSAMVFPLDYFESVDVPIIGGRAEFVPLFSKAVLPGNQKLDSGKFRKMIDSVQIAMEANDEFPLYTDNPAYVNITIEAEGALSVLFSLIRGLEGSKGEVRSCYVESKLTELPFFGSRVILGRKGVEGFIEADLHGLAREEVIRLEMLKEDLLEDIQRGIDFGES